MIINLRPKKLTNPNEIRYRKKFFLCKKYRNKLYILQFMYIKEQFCVGFISDYENAKKKYEAGLEYDKGCLRAHKWYDDIFCGSSNTRWKQLDILTKKEAFNDAL